MRLDLATEEDPEILRKAAQMLERENERLIARIVTLTRRLSQLESKDGAAQLTLEIEKLEQQLSRARQTLFGASSEKRADAEQASNQAEATETKPNKPKKTGHGPRQQKTRRIRVATPDQRQAIEGARHYRGTKVGASKLYLTWRTTVPRRGRADSNDDAAAV